MEPTQIHPTQIHPTQIQPTQTHPTQTPPRAAHKLDLRGLELRYVLDVVLAEADGPRSVADLIASLERDGFAVRGRPGKVISDTLRWETAKGRVQRLGPDRYLTGTIPPTTRLRMTRRVRVLREAALSAPVDTTQRAGDSDDSPITLREEVWFHP